MKLLLERYNKTPEYTEGNLYINDTYFSKVLEDPIREAGEKIYGETAIPYGKYEVVISYSNKFGKLMPEILNIPNFSGVRFHSGNTVKDTKGCILTGENINNGVLTNSKTTDLKLFNKLNVAFDKKEKITLDVVDKKTQDNIKILKLIFGLSLATALILTGIYLISKNK